MTVSDDDQRPVIKTWDLRNAHAAQSVFSVSSRYDTAIDTFQFRSWKVIQNHPWLSHGTRVMLNCYCPQAKIIVPSYGILAMDL